MIELEPKAWEKILLEKMVVHFTGDFPDRVAEKYFRVKRTQEIPHDRAFIIAPGSSHDFDLSDEDATGLYPTKERSLYEILIGVKSTSGSMLLYPRFPINEYWMSLEEGGWTVDLTSDKYRYIGPFSEKLTPPDKPQLRYHTVKDLQDTGLRIYNDGPADDKAVLEMVINRCLLEEVKKEELTEKEIERAREIIFPGLSERGGW